MGRSYLRISDSCRASTCCAPPEERVKHAYLVDNPGQKRAYLVVSRSNKKRRKEIAKKVLTSRSRFGILIERSRESLESAEVSGFRPENG